MGDSGAARYDVILADPPWKFEYWVPGQGKKNGSRAAEAHYPVMDTADICRLPIADLASDNCVLFLWAVWPRIQDALDVIKAWGFTYKTKAFTWVKANPTGFGHFMGMGYYTRANDESCLLGVKGSMPVDAHDVLSILYFPVHRHSQKPEDQYRRIERLYPGRRYLELFARRKRAGWDSWGNEVESDIVLAPQQAELWEG